MNRNTRSGEACRALQHKSHILTLGEKETILRVLALWEQVALSDLSLPAVKSEHFEMVLK